MKTKLFFLAFLTSLLSWGQASLPLTRTAWGATPIGWTDNGTQRTSSYACSGSDGGSLQGNGTQNQESNAILRQKNNLKLYYENNLQKTQSKP